MKPCQHVVKYGNCRSCKMFKKVSFLKPDSSLPSLSADRIPCLSAWNINEALNSWTCFRMWISWGIYLNHLTSDHSFQHSGYCFKEAGPFSAVCRCLSQNGQNLHELTSLHYASNPLELNVHTHMHTYRWLWPVMAIPVCSEVSPNAMLP